MCLLPGCPIYAKYQNFTLTASGRVIKTQRLVGLRDPLSLSCEVPSSDPEITAELYWRTAGGTGNVYFASCHGSYQPCYGDFTLSGLRLLYETQVVYVGVSFKYREVDPVFQEDWFVVNESESVAIS